MSEEGKDFAERLKQIVRDNGGNTAFAQKAGIPLRTLNYYLAGKSKPNLIKLIALASAAGVSLDWLATGEGEMFKVQDEPAESPQNPTDSVYAKALKDTDVKELLDFLIDSGATDIELENVINTDKTKIEIKLKIRKSENLKSEG